VGPRASCGARRSDEDGRARDLSSPSGSMPSAWRRWRPPPRQHRPGEGWGPRGARSGDPGRASELSIDVSIRALTRVEGAGTGGVQALGAVAFREPQHLETRPIAPAPGPMVAAQRLRCEGLHSRCARWAWGMCSGTVVCRPWATRLPGFPQRVRRARRRVRSSVRAPGVQAARSSRRTARSS
jgi:hypothetical protein